MAGQRLIMFESPTGTGKTQTILCSTLAILQSERMFGDKGENGPKLLYFTRTVSQMNQVIEEIKKGPYTVKASIMSSRHNLCLNKNVNSTTIKDINVACVDSIKEQTCPYKIESRSKDNQAYDNVFDIEDLKEFGEVTRGCPYFFAKNMASVSNVIVLSYKYLVDPLFRKNINEYLEDSIIVFDEAHNLCNVLEDAASFELSLTEIDIIGRDLDVLAESVAGSSITRISRLNNSLPVVYMLKGFLEDIKKVIREKRRDRKTDNEYLNGREAIEIFSLTLINKEFDKLRDIQRMLNELQMQSPVEKFIIILVSMCRILRTDKSLFDSFKIHIDKNCTLNSICLDPSLEFNEIVKKRPRSILLVSGTLRPFDLLEKQLKMNFEVKFSKMPNIEEWKKKLMTIKLPSFFHFNDNKKLSLNYTNRNELSNIKAFIEFLSEINKVTPGGILVFLPCYSLLNEYRDTINKYPTLHSKLKKDKFIFFESKNKDFRKQFKDYQKKCKAKGAVFFVVFNGKFSEGMDFKHEFARMVILVGIPFPSLMDLRIQAKKLYLTEKVMTKAEKDKEKKSLGIFDQLKENKKELTFKEWYENEAMTLVNQAAGRIKRNSEDYGVVLFLDKRYDHKNYDYYITQHMKEVQKKVKSFSQFTTVLNGFYIDNKKRETIEKIEEDEKEVLKIIYDKADEEENGKYECVVCFNKSNDKTAFLISNCKHIACKICWRESLKNKLECIMCKERTRWKNLKLCN